MKMLYCIFILMTLVGNAFALVPDLSPKKPYLGNLPGVPFEKGLEQIRAGNLGGDFCLLGSGPWGWSNSYDEELLKDAYILKLDSSGTARNKIGVVELRCGSIENQIALRIAFADGIKSQQLTYFSAINTVAEELENLGCRQEGNAKINKNPSEDPFENPFYLYHCR